MIAGRPTNLWLGLAVAIQGAISGTLIALGLDAVVVGTVSALWGAVVGALILLVASRPPTLNPGDTFHVTTPSGQPNVTTTVATPPAHDPAPVPGG